MTNTINQSLACLGVVFLAIFLEIALTAIYDNLDRWVYITVIILEWMYICHLQNNRTTVIDNLNLYARNRAVVIKENEV